MGDKFLKSEASNPAFEWQGEDPGVSHWNSGDAKGGAIARGDDFERLRVPPGVLRGRRSGAGRRWGDERKGRSQIWHAARRRRQGRSGCRRRRRRAGRARQAEGGFGGTDRCERLHHGSSLPWTDLFCHWLRPNALLRA